VPATLAAIAGEAAPLGVGIDLRQPPRTDDPPARAEFFGNPAQTGPALLRQWGPLWNTPARAVAWNGTKLVELSGRRELYDLAADPLESHDLSEQRAASAEALTPLLPPLSVSPPPPGRALTPEQRDALRALGYLED
jgi:hypothetical protein